MRKSAIAIFGTAAVCIALGVTAVCLYRSYRIADIISDEAAQDDMNRFTTAAETYYSEYFEGLNADKPRDVSEHFSSELKDLWEKCYGVPDWDLYLLAQDWDNPGFEIISAEGDEQEADVSVKITNLGTEKMNVLHMVREGDSWLIDNFVADGYDLKALLANQILQEQEPEWVFDKLAFDMVHVDSDSGSFFICRYEVTQKLWTEVMKDNPSQMQGDDLPVEQVSWDDCQTFISRLNEQTGMKYRLPTEAEWEYACRGGKLSKGYTYSGSDDIDEVAWYDGNSEGKTHPVGQKLPNELGLYDMSGNVWELCQDMHDGIGMCRGGSWIHNARNCDPSLPNETPRAFSINSLGLRLAL